MPVLYQFIAAMSSIPRSTAHQTDYSSDIGATEHNDADIISGITEMQSEFPSILYNLYTLNWLTGTQYHTSCNLVQQGSMTMLNAYVNYIYDMNINKLVERVLRRVLYSVSNIQLPPFTDIHTSTYLNAHIEHLHNTQQLTLLEYQYLQAQLHQSNVVLEAALACVTDEYTGGITELHDTLIRLAKQYIRQKQYIESVYNELQSTSTTYIHWYYQRCLNYKTCATLEPMSQTIRSADCMYLLDLLQYDNNNDTGCDVLYAAMDVYMRNEQLLDTSNDTAYQCDLVSIQDELDDTLGKLSQKWRLDCEPTQQNALRTLKRLNVTGQLLSAEIESLEEYIYLEHADTIDTLLSHTTTTINDDICNLIDETMQPEYLSALSKVHTVLQLADNNPKLQPLTLAGAEYIQSLIEDRDPALLAIGSLYTDATHFSEVYDSISRLSCKWRVVDAQPNQQQLLVLLNHLIDSNHIPASMGETLELCVYRKNAKLLNEFDRFTATHNANQDISTLDRNWETMWNVLCIVLAKHHKGVESL